MIYIIWDYWEEGNTYYCIVYKDDKLYFSEAKGLEKKEKFTVMKFFNNLFKKGRNGKQSG
jgi:hypothetical protein